MKQREQENRAGVDLEPFLVKPKTAGRLLNCGVTRVYELINSGALESFMDGTNRKITTRSIRAHIDRQLAAQGGEKRDTPKAAMRSVAARRAKNAALESWPDEQVQAEIDRYEREEETAEIDSI